jgi:hypothetical protein
MSYNRKLKAFKASLAQGHPAIIEQSEEPGAPQDELEEEQAEEPGQGSAKEPGIGKGDTT